MFKVIIAGGREFSDYRLLKERCDHFLARQKNVVVISGCARGADMLGERWAYERGHDIMRMPADWEKHGKMAGRIRNVEMAKQAHAVIAFWDGESHGTKHMIETAVRNGLGLKVVRF
jgi:hypothetical protein